MPIRGLVVAAAMLLALGAGAGVARADEPEAAQPAEPTPPRVSYIHGEVSFWRPGADEWTEARTNTPLAPGDLLYTGAGGTVEIQFGPRAFVRAGHGTQIGLDNQEPDFVQFRVTSGHAALDLRELPTGHTVELATPSAAFTVERTGYYHLAVAEDATTFRTHRGGSATVTPAGAAAMPVAASQQVVVTAADMSLVQVGPAPALSAWDNWNYQRSAYLAHPSNTRYLSPSVYGAETLAQYGTWRAVEEYGAVWVPTAVAPGWVPYSTGRWIWDPRFGWTWLDDAPWGWAPYHYGRWVFVSGYWAWAPGPIVVRPAYAPALVVFLGGPVSVSVGVRPVHWAPLGWGEPVIPWWGRPGFVGVAWWGGWGGPRVVNNVVVSRTTTVNVTSLTVYRNVHVHSAVVGVPAERFGRGRVPPARVEAAQARELRPVRGPLGVRPVPASVVPDGAAAVRPPAAVVERKVVATRPPRDVTPTLQSQGLGADRGQPRPAAPRLVPAPPREKVQASTPPAPGSVPADKGRRDAAPEGRRATPSRDPARDPSPGLPRAGSAASAPPTQAPADRGRAPAEQKVGSPTPPGPRPQQPAPPPAADTTPSRAAPPRAKAAQDPVAAPGRSEVTPGPGQTGPGAKGSGEPRGRGEREQGPPPRDTERPEKSPR